MSPALRRIMKDPISEHRRLRARASEVTDAARRTRDEAILAVDRARNLVHALRLKRQVARIEEDRRTDPPLGTRVAVLDSHNRSDARIDIHRDQEVRYWSEKLGISRDALRCAVAKVGPMLKDVRDHLKQSRD